MEKVWIRITIIAFIGTLIESLPFQDIDNITVTVAAVLTGHLLGL
jgi:dolichol kinase